MTAIQPFHLDVPEAELDDLRARLARTRWPDAETVDDTSQGPPLAKLQALVTRWGDGYDWRRCETLLNGFGQHRAEIDGLRIHFLHIRSPEADALPLLMTHRWPSSVLEFPDVIGPLTDPAAYGGHASDAFHLVIPSLPGFGFSDKPTTTGWNIDRIADAWIILMERLGYDRWAAQGGDWGSAVTTALGYKAPRALVGIHLNMAMFQATEAERADATPEEQRMLDDAQRYDQRRELGTALLGDDAGNDGGRHAADADADPDRHQHVSRRAAAPVQALGRGAVRRAGSLQPASQGRALRGDGAARDVRGRAAGDVPDDRAMTNGSRRSLRIRAADRRSGAAIHR